MHSGGRVSQRSSSLALESNFSRRDARDVEQIIDEAGEMIGLSADDAALFGFQLPFREAVCVDNGQGVVDRAERVAQLVAQHREELIALADGVAGVGEKIAHFILPAPGAKGGLDGGDERDDAVAGDRGR